MIFYPLITINNSIARYIRMKKYILLVAVCGLLAACDPEYTLDFSVSNDAPKDLTIRSYRVDRLDSIVDSQVYTVLAGKTPTVDAWYGIGSLSLEEARDMMRRQVWRDSMLFEFSDGRQMTFRVDSMVTDGPYDFSSKRYDYLEKTKKGHTYYGSLTYTVTSADYDAAVQP